MDYFMDSPVNFVPSSSNERVSSEDAVESIWSAQRVENFLENNLGLSKKHKIKGRIVVGHNEALLFWNELITKGKLTTPFSVIHVDSHADLGLGFFGPAFILDEMIRWPVDIRIRNIENEYEYNGKFYKIDIGDYLVFAIAYRWIDSLTYCANPNSDAGDIYPYIIKEGPPQMDIDKPLNRTILLKPREDGGSWEKSAEPEVPMRILPRIDDVLFDGDFDYIVFAQSPNYTPVNADFIIEIVKQYMDII